MADDEFYDAVESGLDKIEEEQELRDRLKSGQVPVTPPPTSPASQHRLWPEVSYSIFLPPLGSTIRATHVSLSSQ